MKLRMQDPQSSAKLNKVSISWPHLAEIEYIENNRLPKTAANGLLSRWSLVRVQPRLPRSSARYGQLLSCATNNGNLQSAGRAIPLNVTRNFAYNKLDRLTSAQETGGSSEWNQTYTYDPWGNRAVSGNYIPNAYARPTALTQYSNNRWLGSGIGYDNNGNQKTLPSRSLTYDAENRLSISVQPNMPAISYAYDGQGHRVQKTVGSAVTSYVYDASGQLTAEYGTTPAAGGKIPGLHVEIRSGHLGRIGIDTLVPRLAELAAATSR